ncbi:MAG: redox-sensing transcriptional repressor Rex [Spirochaetes bacterium]|nr:redox-sensing transcriptional repressor Rex [Spirochaetota bacterium]MBN2771158.1 redox-sensing transcriptional repressor Rex [Spirochaetota bacterium]
MIHSIPEPAIKRLSALYQLLCRLEKSGVQAISSKEIGERLDISAHTVRKDISYLREAQISGARYTVQKLKELIGRSLKFTTSRKACVVGLGKIGAAILNYSRFGGYGFDIVAGFDSNVNIVETLNADMDLFPSYMIPEVVTDRSIELAVLAVPADAAQLCADRLVKGGIKGIVNFSSALLTIDKKIAVSDVDVTKELRVLSAMISLADR